MGSIEEVEERRRVEEETEAMNRELDEIGRTSVAKAYWRNRQKIWSQAIAEEIEKEIEAGALDPEKPAEEINLSKKNISNHLEEFIEEGIIDSDLPAKEIPKVLRSYITSLERREEEENK